MTQNTRRGLQDFDDIGDPEPETGSANRPPGEGMPGGDGRPRPLPDDEKLGEAVETEQRRRRSAEGGLGEIDFDSFGLLSVTLPSMDELRLCRDYKEAIEEKESDHRRELPSYIDPHELSEAGWGVIFVRDEDPAIEGRLQELLDCREQQAGHLYKKLEYVPGDSARTFLWDRNGETPGVIDPETLPYYLLLVGGPEKLPFELQYQLSINHAVGRIHFDDLDDYERYAAAVVRAEEAGGLRERRATLFSVERGDRATDLLARHLVVPLEDAWSTLAPGWSLEVRRGPEASKQDLRALLEREEPPGFLVLSAHGFEAPAGHPDQETWQGALVCQEGELFDAGEVSEDMRLDGQVVFCFACYGAGTPVEDNFPFVAKGDEPPALALRPFLAHLPGRLLSRGALAVLGHVDRGWTLSFAWRLDGQEKTAVYSLKDALYRLLSGERLGHAVRPLLQRYKALAAWLADEIERHESDPEIAADPEARKRLALQWMAHNDARNFIVLGDPAVYVLGQRGPSV